MSEDKIKKIEDGVINLVKELDTYKEALRIACEVMAKECIEMEKFKAGFGYKESITAEEMTANFIDYYLDKARKSIPIY
jgi:predicted translin family RNA/ssDNA-binding protein